MKFLQKTVLVTLSIVLILGMMSTIDKGFSQDPQTEYQKKKEEYEREKARIEAENIKKASELEEQKRITASRKAYNDGGTYLKKGMADEALKSYELAIQYDNNFALAYHGKGVALAKLRRYEEALNSYHKAVQLDPLYADGYLALAKLYRQLDKYDEALTMCLKAIAADTSSGNSKPKDLAAAYYELGYVYNKRNEFQKAADAFAEVGKLDPRHYRSFNAQGVALEKAVKSDEAIEAYKKAVEVKSDYYEAYARMAALYNKLGQHQNALDAALNSLKYKKNYALAAYEAGTAYKNLGQLTNAIQYFEIASRDRAWAKSAAWEIDMIKRKMK
jgi:tetratricopeptide (TPR) repeat protein